MVKKGEKGEDYQVEDAGDPLRGALEEEEQRMKRCYIMPVFSRNNAQDGNAAMLGPNPSKNPRRTSRYSGLIYCEEEHRTRGTPLTSQLSSPLFLSLSEFMRGALLYPTLLWCLKEGSFRIKRKAS